MILRKQDDFFLKRIDFLILSIVILSYYIPILDAPLPLATFRVTAYNTLILMYVMLRLGKDGVRNLISMKQFKSYLFVIVFGSFIELFHAQVIQDSYYPILLFYNMFITYIIVYYLFDNYQIDELLLYLSKILFRLSLLLIIYAMVVKVTHNDIQYFGKHFYQITPYRYGVSLRQRISDDFRLSSIFSNPNYFSQFLNVAFGLQVFRIFKLGSKYTLQGVINLILILFGILLTGSRNDFFGSIIFLFVFVVLFFRKQIQISLKKSKNVRVIVLCLSFVIIFSSIKLLEFRGFGTSGRVDLWQYASQPGKNNFLLGIGTKNLNQYLSINDYAHAHNSFIQVFSSGGIVYLTIYIYILVSIIKMNYYTYNRQPTLSSIYALSFMANYIFSNLFTTTVLVTYPFISYMNIFLLINNDRN